VSSVRRLWPAPTEPLDEAALRAAYEPDRSRPWLRVNFVTSLDGAVSVEGRSHGLSSPVDKRVFALLREQADAVLVGAGTVRAERYGPARLDPAAQARRVAAGRPPHPTLVVVSGSLDLEPTGRPLREAPVRAIVLTHDAAPADRRATLAEVADVVACGAEEVDLTAGLAELRARGLGQVLCEGGPRLFDELLAADLVDELCLSVAARLVGAGPQRIVTGTGRPAPMVLRPELLLLADDMLLTRYTRP
jgi:riboflavin-specific deaminase-like protein